MVIALEVFIVAQLCAVQAVYGASEQDQHARNATHGAPEVQRFHAWCQDREVHVHKHLKLDIEERNPSSRLLLSEQSIAPGEELVEAPLYAVLSSWSMPPSFLVSLGRRLHNHDSVRDMIALITNLLIEVSKSENSTHAAYNALLPSMEELLPAVAWSELALQWLPPRTRLKTQLARQSLKEAFEGALMPAVAETPDFATPEIFNWPRFVWAYGIVSSRSFNLSSFKGSSGKTQGLFLFPGGDLLNHHPNASVAWVLDEAEQVVAIRTLAPIIKKAQAFNNYGAITTSEESLLGWGFILGPQLKDTVYLPIPKPWDENAKWRIEGLRTFGFTAIPPTSEIDDPESVIGLYPILASASSTESVVKDLIFCWCVLLAAPSQLHSLLPSVRFSEVKSNHERFMEFGVGRSATAGAECGKHNKDTLREKAATSVIRALLDAIDNLAPRQEIGSATSESDKVRKNLAEKFATLQKGIFLSVVDNKLLARRKKNERRSS